MVDAFEGKMSQKAVTAPQSWTKEGSQFGLSAALLKLEQMVQELSGRIDAFIRGVLRGRPQQLLEDLGALQRETMKVERSPDLRNVQFHLLHLFGQSMEVTKKSGGQQEQEEKKRKIMHEFKDNVDMNGLLVKSDQEEENRVGIG